MEKVVTTSTRSVPRGLARPLFLLALPAWLALSPLAGAWELQGSKTLSALTRDQQLIPLGQVEFQPAANGTVTFTLAMDHGRFADHFLSMKEFKCLEGGDEVLCHVPYPYRNPATVSAADYSWLEHQLLFLYKQPRDFGAKLWNGLYFRLQADADRNIRRFKLLESEA